MRASTLPRGQDTAMLRLYVWAMIVTTGLAVMGALLATRTDPQYSSSAEILIGPTITSSGNYIQPSMPTEQRVATSADVISAASAQLGVTAKRPLQHLSVTVPVDTQILVMTYTADTPTAALAGAKAFAKTYLGVRNPESGKDAVASLVSPPTLPSKPETANYPVILGVAVLGGLAIGLGVARVWDRVRGRIRTVDDAERCTDLDALALTPQLPRASTKRERRIGTGRSQLGPLAARVLGEVEGGAKSTLLVSGTTTGCGTTTVAVLTALSLARMGRVVVLVTADNEVVARMSRDRDHHAGTDTHSGDWPAARAAEQEGLHLVAVADWDGAGVAAARLTSLLPELRDRLPDALIVVDGPPAWLSAGLALQADKILLVVALGRCSRSSASAAAQALDQGDEKLMGLVVTPARGHVRHELASARERIVLLARRLMFRIGPASGGLAPPSARWPRAGAAPAPRGWTGPIEIDLQHQRTPVRKTVSARKTGRLRESQPSEPTGSVL